MTNLIASISNPDFVQAMLLALLPHISDFSARLDLPIEQPVTTNHVRKFFPKGDGTVGGVVTLTNSFRFIFERGHVNQMSSPASYYLEQNPNNIPKYFGKVNFDKKEAEKIARDTLTKLGFSPEMVYADLPPSIEPPTRTKGNTIARYRVVWHDPRTERETAYFEINSETGEPTYLNFHSFLLSREDPKIPNFSQPVFNRFPRGQALSPVETIAAQSRVLSAVEDFSLKLGSPLPSPITTNLVAAEFYHRQGGILVAEMHLTNGMVFNFEYGIISMFESKQHYFTTRRDIYLKDYYGPWHLSEKQSIQIAREALTKLGYNPKDFDLQKKPQIKKPTLPNIPRYVFSWSLMSGGVVKYSYGVEVNAATGAIEHLDIMHPKVAKEFPQRQGSQQKRENERTVLRPASSNSKVVPTAR